ncbi:MAG: hypothetical protein WCP73_00135 [Eubacteriales bacterium]
MKKVKINPGVCGLITMVQAESEDGMEVKIEVASGCDSIKQMMQELGNTFDAFALCLSRPGKNNLYQFAAEHFPGHAACPAIAGIIKCAEAECGLALPRNAEITFE